MYTPDGPEERTAFYDESYDLELADCDAREAAADELNDALVDIASTRIDAFGVMRDL